MEINWTSWNFLYWKVKLNRIWNELMQVIKWNTEKIFEKLAIKVNVHWGNIAIAEILLSEKNLYNRPWHVVVDLLIMLTYEYEYIKVRVYKVKNIIQYLYVLVCFRLLDLFVPCTHFETRILLNYYLTIKGSKVLLSNF